jgi:Flp pilus assembly protein TadG
MRGDQGAVLVEAALALPVLVVLSLGLVEYGMVFHESIVIQRAINSVGRTISNLADDRMADYEGLRALSSATSSLRQAKLRRAIVYKSTTSNGQVPAACMSINPSPLAVGSFGVNGVCNVYTRAQMETQAPSGFPSSGSNPKRCTSAAWDFNWCPSGQAPSGAARNRSLPDYVGVYVEFEYDSLTMMISGPFTIEQRGVFALEPPVAVGS